MTDEIKEEVRTYVSDDLERPRLKLVIGDTVIPLVPREHFVSRSYRMLKKLVQPTSFAVLDKHLKLLAPLMDQILNPEKFDLQFQDLSLSTDKDKFTRQIRDVCDNLESQVLEYTKKRIDSTKAFWEAMQSMLTEVELVDSADTDKFAKFVTDCVQTTYDFYDSEQDEFLNNSSLEFYIFREERRTLYVIWDYESLTCLTQQMKKYMPNSVSLAKTELDHMRSCYVRFLRGKKKRYVPENFIATPETVRKYLFGKKKLV